MGVKAHTTYTLKCDRCEVTEKSDLDPTKVDMNTWQYWVRQSVDGPHAITQRLLCGRCAHKLEIFMMGLKTPRGVRFNQGEDERYYENAAASC